MHEHDPRINNCIVELLLMRARLGLVTPPDLTRFIVRSARYEHMHRITDRHERPAGYIIWACINKETYADFLQTGRMPKYQFEWNEGSIVLILDVAFNKDYSPYNLRQLLDSIFPRRRLILFARKKTISVYCRTAGAIRLHRKKNFIRPVGAYGTVATS